MSDTPTAVNRGRLEIANDLLLRWLGTGEEIIQITMHRPAGSEQLLTDTREYLYHSGLVEQRGLRYSGREGWESQVGADQQQPFPTEGAGEPTAPPTLPQTDMVALHMIGAFLADAGRFLHELAERRE